MSCSNEEGCDPCTTEEINTLLQGLMHGDPVVRGIVLKVMLNKNKPYIIIKIKEIKCVLLINTV